MGVNEKFENLYNGLSKEDRRALVFYAMGHIPTAPKAWISRTIEGIKINATHVKTSITGESVNAKIVFLEAYNYIMGTNYEIQINDLSKTKARKKT